jgi:hypothetical protein
MTRGRKAGPGVAYPEQVYAALPTIAGLARVAPRRIEIWVAQGRLAPLITTEPRPPRRMIRLYRLSEVLGLKAMEKE